MNTLTRRTVLRGVAAGAGVAVGLPILDMFLDDRGAAFAATGKPLPPVFGTWYQHLGLNPGMWEPEIVGAGFENNKQLKVLDPIKSRLNVYSGMGYFLDGRPLQTHRTPVQIATTGEIPVGTNGLPSLDSRIADVIGTKTRFRSLEVSLKGSAESVSQRSGATKNPSEGSPANLYKRIFVDGFTDPNSAQFTPDPLVLARKSVLSAVAEDRASLVRALGAADKRRLDEYFTSLRQLENQLATQLERPDPLSTCTVPSQPSEAKPSSIIEHATVNSKLFATLIAHALACGQTRVFNVFVGSMDLRQEGKTFDWHMATHEEALDEHLGYQKEVFAFNTAMNKAFLEFVQTLEQFKEGAGTLLDRTLLLWQTDHGDARVHSLDKVPVMTVGNGGGRLKTGIHVAAPGDPVTRVGLTVMQAMGVTVSQWGDRSNQTSKPVREVLV